MDVVATHMTELERRVVSGRSEGSQYAQFGGGEGVVAEDGIFGRDSKVRAENEWFLKSVEDFHENTV